MMQQTNQLGLDLIKEYEGFSANSYICPGGHLTIGYGHKILEGESFPGAITPESAEALLRKDAAVAERAINKMTKVALTDNQFSALVSFTYNVGVGNFQSSTLLKCLNAGEYEAVPEELARWVFSRGKKLPGLIKRREAEGNLFALVVA